MSSCASRRTRRSPRLTRLPAAPGCPLNAGQCTTVSFPAGGPVPPGAYYLGGVVDPSNSVVELIESNNTRTILVN